MSNEILKEAVKQATDTEVSRLNWNAMLETVNKQNFKIAELVEGQKRLNNTINTQQQQIQNLTAQFAQLMNAKLGGGPTE